MLLSMKWLWDYSRGYRAKLFVVMLLCIGSVALSILFVEFTKEFIDSTIKGEHIVAIMVIGLIGLKIMQLMCEQGEMYFRAVTKAELSNRLEAQMFYALNNSKTQTKEQFHSGDEIYRLSGDVEIVAESMAFTLPVLIYSVIQLIATWAYLMTKQPILTVIIGGIAPIVIFIGYFYTKRLVPISRQVRHEGSKVNEYIQEHLQHHELITILGVNGYVQTQVEKLQYSFLKALKHKIRYTVGADSLAETGFAISYLIIFVWGIYGISDTTISYGEFLVFIQLVGQLQRPMFIFKEQYPSWVASFASVERLMEITRLPKDNESNEELLMSGALGLRFSNVSFRYSEYNKWIFTHFCYDFKPNTITAIVGETGVGKSTLIRMALAIYTPEEGCIEIYNNSCDVYQVSPQTRCNCVFIPQGNSLISGTIRYNLLLGNLNASESQMKEALYIASADFVLEELPDGLDTIIGERGMGISEGQAQRIAIARGLLRNRGLLLLDEPTSALDTITEKQFLERLVKSSINKTIIIITHKGEVCNYVSNIISLKQGTVVYSEKIKHKYNNK